MQDDAGLVNSEPAIVENRRPAATPHPGVRRHGPYQPSVSLSATVTVVPATMVPSMPRRHTK